MLPAGANADDIHIYRAKFSDGRTCTDALYYATCVHGVLAAAATFLMRAAVTNLKQ